MKIAILHPVAGDSSPFKDLDPRCVPDHYLPGHEFEGFDIRKATAVRQVIEIAGRGFDAVINLCDGAWAEDRPGLEVVLALERLGVAFTGAGSRFYEPSREAMKMASHSVGVRFPAYFLAQRPEQAAEAARRLRFPLIVKHPNSYSSIGLTRNSRVTNVEDLQQEVVRAITSFGSALIEEFIEGREFSVLVTEPRNETEDAWALEPVEFVFPEGESFKHFDLKWKDYAAMETQAVLDRNLAKLLREASALAFMALSGTGYGRCDLRVDAAGDVYFLEINPNCGTFYPEASWGSADFILGRDPGGHAGFLEHLLRCAIGRREREKKPWVIRFDSVSGFGMAAFRHIREGEVVERYEERPHVLASRHHVEKNWTGIRRDWFERYAWPVSEGVKAMWSDDPQEWRPLNHSCDPNTWFCGLDVIARSDIRAGDPLTMDYATFCGPSMPPFECNCGAADCRGVILGTDHMLPHIRQRYGGHVSDFVNSAWNRNDGCDIPYMIVRNTVGFGVVASREWRPGDAIAPLLPENVLQTPNRWTIQFAADRHAEPRPYELRYINHSCSPNVIFDVDAGVLRALKPISPGDELCCFYPATEWAVDEAFDCLCRSAECIGRVAGAAQTPLDTLQRQTLCAHIQDSLRDRQPNLR